MVNSIFKFWMGMGYVLIPIFYFKGFSESFGPAKWLAVYLWSFISIGLIAIEYLIFWIFPQTSKWNFGSLKFQKDFTFSKLLKAFFAALVLAFLFYFVSILFNGKIEFYSNTFLDLLSGVCIAIVCFYFGFGYGTQSQVEARNRIDSSELPIGNGIFKNRDLFFYALLGGVLVLVYAGLQTFSYDLLQLTGGNVSPSESKFPSSFFGYANITAEYLVYILVWGVWWTIFNRASKVSFILKTIVFAFVLLGIFVLLKYNVRTSWVSLIAGVFPLLYLGVAKNRVRLRRILFFGIAGFLLFFTTKTVLLIMSPSEAATDLIKWGNTRLRIARILNGIEMVKERPLVGIGPGRYEFEYIPFHRAVLVDEELSESLLIKSPHNGYLEAAIDSGIPFLIFLISVIVLWLIGVGRLPDQSVKAFFLSQAFVTLIQALFNFPMENAFPFFHTVIVFSLGTALILKNESTLNLKLAPVESGDLERKKRFFVSSFPLLLLTAVSLVGFTGSYVYYYSHNVEFNWSFDMEASEKGCTLFPSNWRTCMNQAQLQIEFGKISQAKDLLQNILEHWPSHFLARRFLALVYFKEGNSEQGCLHLLKFERLFEGGSRNPDLRGHSSIVEKSRELCKRYWK